MDLNPRVRRARIVVLVFLATNVVWAVGIPLSRLRLEPWWIGGTVVVLLAVHSVLYVATLNAAVSPWVESRSRSRLMIGLLLTSGALWPLMYLQSVPGEEPWAWLAAFVIGVGPLVLPGLWAGAVALALGGLAVLGAVLWQESVLQNLGFSLGGGAVVAALGLLVVWMLRLLTAAEAGREAEAKLAVSEERLRFARDLHDVLGQRLTAIALKAELAADLAGRLDGPDAGRAREEAEEIRDLASSALQEARQAVHGYGTVDLPAQLTSAQIVLGTAGIEATLQITPLDLGPAQSQLLGAIVREGITNILRHSDAQHVRITLAGDTDSAELVIANDRPNHRTVDHPPGIGLAGLADRAAQLGARLATTHTDDAFELRVELAPR
jgi:two-component system, NarL family, sensor histidine kinase DesK